MNNLKRRTLFCLLSGAALSAVSFSHATAQDRTSVKIGYAVSKSGANATGAGITTIPNYKLWVKEVNDAGGLTLPDGKRLPVDVVEYDDRSSAEDAVRFTERLASQDKVDFILPPWARDLIWRLRRSMTVSAIRSSRSPASPTRRPISPRAGRRATGCWAGGTTMPLHWPMF